MAKCINTLTGTQHAFELKRCIHDRIVSSTVGSQKFYSSVIKSGLFWGFTFVRMSKVIYWFLLIDGKRDKKCSFSWLKESALVSNSVTASCTTENRANIVNVLAESFCVCGFYCVIAKLIVSKYIWLVY